MPDPLSLLDHPPAQPADQPASSALPTVSEEDAATEKVDAAPSTDHSQASVVVETLPSETVVFGETAQRRGWPEEDRMQSRDLHRKHLVALHDVRDFSFRSEGVTEMGGLT